MPGAPPEKALSSGAPGGLLARQHICADHALGVLEAPELEEIVAALLGAAQVETTSFKWARAARLIPTQGP